MKEANLLKAENKFYPNRHRFAAVIPAAGSSRRYGKPKLLERLNGKSVLYYSVTPFLRLGLSTIVVLPRDPQLREKIREELARDIGSELIEQVRFVIGGEKRWQSVRNAINSLNEERVRYVMVHDAARPMVDEGLILRVACRLLEGNRCVIPVITPPDTVRYVRDGKTELLDRSQVLLTQTPQGFDFTLLKRLLNSLEEDKDITDECTLFQMAGYVPSTVEGSRLNLKLTYTEDMEMLKAIIDRKTKTEIKGGALSGY